MIIIVDLNIISYSSFNIYEFVCHTHVFSLQNFGWPLTDFTFSYTYLCLCVIINEHWLVYHYVCLKTFPLLIRRSVRSGECGQQPTCSPSSRGFRANSTVAIFVGAVSRFQQCWLYMLGWSRWRVQANWPGRGGQALGRTKV